MRTQTRIPCGDLLETSPIFDRIVPFLLRPLFSLSHSYPDLIVEISDLQLRLPGILKAVEEFR